MTLLKVEIGVPMKQNYSDKIVANKQLITGENKNIHF